MNGRPSVGVHGARYGQDVQGHNENRRRRTHDIDETLPCRQAARNVIALSARAIRFLYARSGVAISCSGYETWGDTEGMDHLEESSRDFGAHAVPKWIASAYPQASGVVLAGKTE